MRTIMLVATTLVLVAPLGAQGRGRNTNGVPPGFRPPPGLCRVWIDGVPPGHQPGVTSCVTALATVPSNGRVIFGDQTTARRYGKGYTVRRVTGVGTIFTRRLYDDNGDYVLQRLRRESNGTYTLLSSTILDRATRTVVSGDDDNDGGARGHGNGHGNGRGNGKGHGKH